MSTKTMLESFQGFVAKKVLDYFDESPESARPKLLAWADKFDKDNLILSQRKVFHQDY